MNLKYDFDEAYRHLLNCYPTPWPGYININVFQMSDQKHKKQLLSLSLGAPDDIEKFKPVLNLHASQGHHIFFTVGYHKAGGKQSKSDFVATNVLWSDIDDIGPKQLEERLEGIPLYPTGVIRSGGGYHLYWVLDTPESDVPTIELALKKIRSWVAGDAVGNVNRLLRLPGTWTVKPWKYDGPKVCKIDWWNSTRIYKLEQFFQQRFSVNEIRLERDFVKKFIIDGSTIGDGHRSTRDFAVMKELVAAGHTKEEISEIFHNPEWEISSKVLERKGEDYFNRTYSNAVAEVGNSSTGVKDNGEVVIKCKYIKGHVEEEVISNFVIIPSKIHKIMETGEEFLDAVVRSGDRVRHIIINSSELVSPTSFIVKAGMIGLSWLGTVTDFMAYIQYLFSMKIQEVESTQIVGWYGQSFVTPDEVLFDDGISYISNGVNHYITLGESHRSFEEMMNELYVITKKIQDNRVSFFTLGWFLSCAFAPFIRQDYAQQFPILLLHGQKGTGKTTLARIYNKYLYGCEIDYSFGTTYAVIRRALSSSNAIPMVIDEHVSSKQSDKESQKIMAALRCSWQAGHAQIYDINIKQVDGMCLQAPCCLTTMFALQDDALLDRMLQIRVHRHIDIERGQQAIEMFEKWTPGAFLRRWLEQPPNDWIKEIKVNSKKIRKKIPDLSERQIHCLSVPISVLNYCDQNYWKMKIDFSEFLGDSDIVSHIENTTPKQVIDTMLAYMIRRQVLLKNHTISSVEHKLKVHQATFYDSCVCISRDLDFPYDITRMWVSGVIKDLCKDQYILSHSKTVEIGGKRMSGITFDIRQFPLSQEAWEVFSVG